MISRHENIYNTTYQTDLVSRAEIRERLLEQFHTIQNETVPLDSDPIYKDYNKAKTFSLAGTTKTQAANNDNDKTVKRDAPLVPGSKMQLWKQDPTSDIIGVSTVFIPSVVKAGPADDQIVVVPPKGARPAAPNRDGDFETSPEKNLMEFEMVHSYCVVRIVLNMYERFIKQFNPNFKIKWAWDSPSYIQVIPRAGEEANAYYSRDSKSIELYYYKQNRKTYYTCHSFDIIAHECGHAVLDGLRPMWVSSNHAETIAAHESFADLTVIFSLLSQMDVIEILLSETKADLHEDNFLSNLAEQFGQTMMKADALRNCNNQLRMDQVSKQPHELSQVMTGCVYDIIAELLHVYMQPELFDTAESLLRVSKWVKQMFMFSVFHSPKEKVTFRELGMGFLAFAEKDDWEQVWKDIVKQNLVDRKII